MALTGKNISLPIYYKVNGVETPFHDLVLKKFTVDSVVMSLGDKITGDVYYIDKNLVCSMQEYVVFNGIEYTLVNPPTLVKEGLVKDNSDLKGMCKYSFEFYHPMYILGNLPFTDVAVSYDEMRYKSQDKTFSWIGRPADFVAKLNKNLDSTEWVVVLSDKFPQGKLNELSEVLSFDNNTIADALKTAYDTWGVPFVIDSLHEGEYFDEHNNDYYAQSGGNKRYLITIGLSSNEILDPNSENGIVVTTTTLMSEDSTIYYSPTARIVVPKGKKIVLQSLTDGVTPIILNSEHNGVVGTTNRTFEENTTIYIGSFNGVGNIRYFIEGENNNIFVFRFGQGVGLKNHSRTPRNNKIVTRLAGYGSENNIPYGYPQVRWYGDPNATCTIGDSVGAKQNVTINGTTYDWAMSYPIYDGIVGGEWVKLIKHPFTRNHLMPTIYAEGVFNKVSQFLPDGSDNLDYNPDIEIKDYYDAIESETYPYVNLINPVAPSYEIHGFDDIKPELGEAYILGSTPINSDLTDADSWDDTMDDNGNYLQSYFKITLPQLTFDIYACAAITQEMQINMRSGACIGCTFTVQVDWEDYKRNFYDSDLNFVPNGEQRDYTRYPDSSQGSITVVVQKDINTFGTLMPNIYQYPAAGDAFVVLGISLPLSYITSAQERLDDAMKSYMLENNVYYFDYPLKFDEHFLATRIDILNQIRPNTIVRFEFNSNILELFVKQLTIKFNESPLPQYDITLTDNVEVVLNQIGQVADDVEHLSSLISILRQQYGKNVYSELAKKLSKVDNDTAQGLISFMQGWETSGFFSNNFFGYGAKVNASGVGEFEEINVRGALRATELIFNRISAEEGEAIRSIGHGEILTVDEENFIATLKLDGDEWPTIDEGDICRGLYNTINKDYDNSSSSNEGEDENGFRKTKGFFASYFKVEEIISSGKGECTFRYSLQTDDDDEIITEHPCPMMKFAAYGNDDDSKQNRQSCMYITAVGIAPRLLFLSHVNDWKIKPENIKVAMGYIDGLQVNEILDGEIVLKTLSGDAGLFVEDNIYLGGIINQFTAADWEYIQNKLGQGIHAQLLRGSDNVIIDALGNVVGGLYVESTDGTTTTRQYKLHTGVLVYDSGKKKYLTIGNPANLGDDEFAMYVVANGCTVFQDGSDVYVTAIDNTANGNILTDSQLQEMRNTNEFTIDFTIVTKNGWRTQMSYPIKITHLDQSYITFDLTNEMDSMSFSEQLGYYVGLPIETTLKAYANGDELANIAYVSTKVTSSFFTSDGTERTYTQTSNVSAITAFLKNNASSGVKCTIYNNGKLLFEGLSSGIDYIDTKYTFDIQCVVKYAGVPYTSAIKRFTLIETTNATLYKLLLSANAISKDEGTYTPSSIDVKAQVIDGSGTNVFTASQLEANGNIKVRYLTDVYNPSISKATLISSWLVNQPNFDQVSTCLTVLLVDNSDVTDPIVLDVESVTINSVGRDGAGQPWVKVIPEQVVIDCDSDGKIKETKTITFTARLYWGEQLCTLDDEACEISFFNGDDGILAYVPANNPTSVSRTYTFTQGDILESKTLNIYLYGSDGVDNHSASTSVNVIANKQGVKGDSGAMIRYRGEYSPTIDASEGYVWNNTFRDCAKYGSSYYLANVDSDGSEPLGTPENNPKWENIGGMKFVATELLLAENGVINLLSSNVINLFNASGIKTASINADGNGEYCIYHQNGVKMFAFSYDKYIHCYHEDGTEAWRIGLGGDIEKTISPRFINFPLCNLDGRSGSVNENDRFVLVNTYWRYSCGNTSGLYDYDGKIYNNNSSTIQPTNPATENVIPDGIYTPDTIPHQLQDTIDSSRFAIAAYVIEGGFITQTLELTDYTTL